MIRMTAIREFRMSPSGLVNPGSSGCRFRRLLKGLGNRAADSLAAGLTGVCGSCAGTRLGILTYHRIAPSTNALPAPTWNITPQQFAFQLKGILARGYRPWPLGKVLDFSRSGQPIPRK